MNNFDIIEIKDNHINYAKERLNDINIGYVAIHSSCLNSIIIFKNNEKTFIPLPLSYIPQYTIEELNLLIKDKINSKSLKTIHTIKELFSGKITEKIEYNTIEEKENNILSSKEPIKKEIATKINNQIPLL